MIKEMKVVQEALEKFEGTKENLKRKTELLEEMKKIRGAWDRNTGLGSTTYDQVPANNNKVNSKVAQIAIKNIELELELEEEIEYLRYQVNVINKALSDLRATDEELYNIIKLKYIEKKTWRYVAYELGISERSVYRRGEKAIEMLYRTIGEEKYSIIFLRYNEDSIA